MFMKGPWKVGYNSYLVEAETSDGVMNICDIRGWGHLTGRGSLNLSHEEAKKIQDANANLIAAAPELLLACEGALNALRLHPHVDKQQAIDYLIEVIKKARGE